MNRVFSRRCDPYGYDTVPYERSRLAAMQRAVGEGRFSHVLEVGCAEGAFTERLAASSDRVTAMDVSPVALSRARARVQDAKVSWIEGDVRSWKPGNDRFDLVVLGDVLYYLDKPLVQDEFRLIFERIVGWLAPEGILLLAHGFASAEERLIRESYRKRFEDLGLRLQSERVVGEGEKEGKVCCLLSLLAR